MLRAGIVPDNSKLLLTDDLSPLKQIFTAAKERNSLVVLCSKKAQVPKRSLKNFIRKCCRMTLPFGLNRLFSVLSPRNITRRAARIAMRLACFAVLAVTFCAGRPLLAYPPTEAHAGGVIPVGSGFVEPIGVAVDGSGNVFVADVASNAVKEIVAVNGMVSSSSTVNTIGSGFSLPSGVAVDASGNVFVADQGNNAVKEIVAVGGMVSSSSTVNTIGSGFSDPLGVAVDGSGNVFVADEIINAVKEIVAVGGVVSSSSTVNTIGSGFFSPYGVAVDGSGNVFVSDVSNGAVKEIVAVGGVVSSSSTVISVGSGFNLPTDVAVDGSGNVFVADFGNNAMKEIVAVGGVVSSSSTVISVGSGISSPTDVAVDGSGNVFVSDYGNNAVKEIVLAPQKLPTTAVASTSASLPVPFTFDDEGIIGVPVVLTQGATGLDFADAGTGTCTTNGTSFIYNAGDTCTVDVTFTPKYPGQRLGAVELTTTDGTVIATAHIYGTGTGPLVTFPSNATVNTISSGLANPTGAAVDGRGNVFIANYDSSTVQEIMAVGGVVSSSSTVTTIASSFYHPYGIAVDGSGNVFVADRGNNAVKEIVAAGGYTTINTIGSGFSFPAGVAVDGSGNVFVTDQGNSAVKEIVAVGGAVSSSSTVNTIGSGFTSPFGITVDGSGNVFVADNRDNLVKEIVAVNGVVSASSTVKTIASGFGESLGVAVDGSGNVFVTDFNSVKEIVAVGGVVSSNSAVNTIASGFQFPVGITMDGRGNVFIADQADNAMSVIGLSDPPSLSFATATNAGSTDVTDGPLTVTVANSGNAALNFPVPTSGNNPSISADFTLDSTSGGTCPLTTTAPNTLAAGASCTLPISFTPKAGGTIGGSLVLTDTNLNANPSTTQTISLNGTGQLATPTLVFATIPAHIYGDTPFSVSATSLSSGTVTYTVTSGPATISGNTVTLTGAGTVVLSATQSATATYAAATATTSFTVSSPPVTDFSFGSSGTSSQTISAGGTAAFSFSLAPVGGAYPGAVSFTATGLPAGATATFSPATIAANGGTQTVTLTVQTSAQATLDMPASHRGGLIVFALLFLPLVGTRRMRRVARRLGRGTGVALLLLLSLGAVAGLSGCGGQSSQAKNYTIAVTASSGSTQHTTNFTLQVK
jgi:DNA-binding beta-propeller fold protein YncE